METEVAELQNEPRVDEAVGWLETTVYPQLAVVQEYHALRE